ncbi:DEAD/DEAH box helicase family protein [Photobacterium sagamiensis]|uniref:DEAD/DEAH box helicase n=1 Tax=Photobacterium sagamiensis TaxID=2910241 RepID=UPI003D126A41
MKLRHWQAECVERALTHYTSISNHFLALATPGAGKTVMAAEVAMRLFEQDKIDLVICFSPSTEVANGIEKTFSHRLNCLFDGGLGAKGFSFTYQKLLTLSERFLLLLESHRVLVILDEVHHCSGNELANANAWGERILAKIQEKAAFTLSMTGTPWRSDNIPISLSRYSKDGQHITCDYVYGLGEAVSDKVCRNPRIVLVDNEKITVHSENESASYSNLREMLEGSSVSYQVLLHCKNTMRYLLGLGCDKLSEIRRINPTAGGLVVASSTKHAQVIIKLLRDDLYQTAILVTHKTPNSDEVIDKFRHNTTQWIVSVNMVSEGTDIPRLQVCCHLSRIKTEMYFRQILGRVLRITRAKDQQAWLYTFAEPLLSDFANRIDQDIPDNIVIEHHMPTEQVATEIQVHQESIEQPTPLVEESALHFCCPQSDFHYNDESSSSSLSEEVQFKLLGRFREQVIATFDSPFSV